MPTKCPRHKGENMPVTPFKPKPTKTFTLDNGLLVELCASDCVQFDVGIYTIFINDIVVWNGGGIGMGPEEIANIARRDYEGLDGVKLFCQKIEEHMSVLASDMKEISDELVRMAPIKVYASYLLESLSSK
jgi:hypothetical protein